MRGPTSLGASPSLLPPRLLRCIRRLAWLMLGLRVAGWGLWCGGLGGLSVWLQASALAIGLRLHVFVLWYLWGN